MRLLKFLSREEVTNEEVLFIVRAIVEFCNTKGINIHKGRPKCEASNITVSKEFYN